MSACPGLEPSHAGTRPPAKCACDSLSHAKYSASATPCLRASCVSGVSVPMSPLHAGSAGDLGRADAGPHPVTGWLAGRPPGAWEQPCCRAGSRGWSCSEERAGKWAGGAWPGDRARRRPTSVWSRGEVPSEGVSLARCPHHHLLLFSLVLAGTGGNGGGCAGTSCSAPPSLTLVLPASCSLAVSMVTRSPRSLWNH